METLNKGISGGNPIASNQVLFVGGAARKHRLARGGVGGKVNLDAFIQFLNPDQRAELKSML